MEAAAGLIAGSGWSAGVNLYLAVLLLNVFGRLGIGEVPEALTRTDVLIVAAVLTTIEFVADKVPYVDNVWDAVHTVIRPVGAGVVGMLLAGEVSDLQQALSAGGAGGLALLSHSAKATARAAINTSPEPASNIFVSLLEDGLVATVVYVALANPVLAGVVVALLVIAGGILMVFAWKLARKGVAAARDRVRRVRTS